MKIINKKERNEFINKVFNYFEKNIPNHKKIFILKRIIERNKILTKIYVQLYRTIKL